MVVGSNVGMGKLPNNRVRIHNLAAILKLCLRIVYIVNFTTKKWQSIFIRFVVYNYKNDARFELYSIMYVSPLFTREIHLVEGAQNNTATIGRRIYPWYDSNGKKIRAHNPHHASGRKQMSRTIMGYSTYRKHTPHARGYVRMEEEICLQMHRSIKSLNMHRHILMMDGKPTRHEFN